MATLRHAKQDCWSTKQKNSLTQNTRVAGGPDVFVAEVGTLELQPGVDHPEGGGDQNIDDTCRERDKHIQYMTTLTHRTQTTRLTG